MSEEGGDGWALMDTLTHSHHLNRCTDIRTEPKGSQQIWGKILADSSSLLT